jgi:hypothetical protein
MGEKIHLKTHDKVTIIAEEGMAIIRHIKGNILDIGGTVKIPEKEKPIDFRKVRKDVIKKMAKKAAASRGK